MRIVKSFLVFSVAALFIFNSGCVPAEKYEDLKVQNKTQQERLYDLESQLRTAELEIGQLKQQLAAAQQSGSTDVRTLRKEIAAFEKAIAAKNDLIEKMRSQLLKGGVVLPVELNTMLQEFADKTDMVTYDADIGVVKFKSDLLFKRGSVTIAPEAVKSIESLCVILNSEQGSNFDIIVAGHTDDIPILRPATKAKHPTDWHLSSHRAISVLNVMQKNKVEAKRLSARGFGEHRPIVPNKPGKKGNPLNRRVEIYIVPAGI